MNSEIFKMVIALLGGLALFIYGMNLMSEIGRASCRERV